MKAKAKAHLFDQARDAEQRGNREGRDLWDRYTGHREHVTAAILSVAETVGVSVAGTAGASVAGTAGVSVAGPAGGSGGRLCLLGAGNGNDLDLAALAARFDEIHLVDIDEAALARAINRQSPAVRAKLRPHAPVDLSGLYRELDVAAARRRHGDELVAAGTAAVLAKLPECFDVVASCCVLSQMGWALSRAFQAEAAEELPALEQALVAIHLRTLVALTQPAGVALLIADLVSSEAYPIDALDANADLPELVRRLSEARIAYAVCNPDLIRQLLRRDPELRALCAPSEMKPPWLWTGSKDLTYLVYPLILRPLRSPLPAPRGEG